MGNFLARLHRPGLLLCVLLIAAALGAGIWLVRDLHLPMRHTQPVYLQVAPGDGLRQVIVHLHEAGVQVQSRRGLLLWGWLTGAARRLHTGEYLVPPGVSPYQLLQMLTSGKVMRRKLVIVEGWRFKDLRRLLAGAERLRQTLTDLDEQQIMARLGHPGVVAEGRFFPDTYYYQAGALDLDVLQRAHARMQQVLAQEWSDRQPGLPLASPDEALALASLIEKETGVAQERARIAGVLVRRLQRGMRLQVDAAVIYGMDEAFNGNLTRRDLRRDTPWNTYTRRGLPATPIALPGRASLHAALHPAPGDVLYYVARGDGTSQFSVTLDEHADAVARYQVHQRATNYRSSPPADGKLSGAQGAQKGAEAE